MSGYFEEQLQKRATEVTRQRSENQGSTAQFGKKPQPGFLPNCAVLPSVGRHSHISELRAAAARSVL